MQFPKTPWFTCANIWVSIAIFEKSCEYHRRWPSGSEINIFAVISSPLWRQNFFIMMLKVGAFSRFHVDKCCIFKLINKRMQYVRRIRSSCLKCLPFLFFTARRCLYICFAFLLVILDSELIILSRDEEFRVQQL